MLFRSIPLRGLLNASFAVTVSFRESPDLSAVIDDVLSVILLTTPRSPVWPLGLAVIVVAPLTVHSFDCVWLPALISTVYFPAVIAGKVPM